MMSTNHPITQPIRRLAGFLGLLGGMALAAAYLTHPTTAPPETVSSTSWQWIHIGFMVSLLAGIFLLIILVAEFVRAGGGWAGVIGFALSVTSLVFVFGLDYSEVFIFPTLAVEFPDVVIKYGDGTSMPSVAFAFPATGAVFVVGFIVFAWQLSKAGVVSMGAGWLTIIGTIVFGAGLSGYFPMLVVRMGAVIYGCGLIWLGLDIAREYRGRALV